MLLTITLVYIDPAFALKETVTARAASLKIQFLFPYRAVLIEPPRSAFESAPQETRLGAVLYSYQLQTDIVALHKLV